MGRKNTGKTAARKQAQTERKAARAERAKLNKEQREKRKSEKLEKQKRNNILRLNNPFRNVSTNNTNQNNNNNIKKHNDSRRRQREEENDEDENNNNNILDSDESGDDELDLEATNLEMDWSDVAAAAKPTNEKQPRFHRNRRFNTERKVTTQYGALLAKIPLHELRLFSIKPESVRAYTGYKRSMVERISYRTGTNFPWTVEGLLDFITDPFVAEDLANNTVGCIVSAFKTLYILDHKRKISEQDDLCIQEMMKARRNIVPESGRITGAINRERLLQVLEFMKKKQQQGSLEEEKYRKFADAAILLYTCTLRIFQLLSITRTSFQKDNNNVYWWVAVPIKGARSELETKLVDFHQDTKDLFEEVMIRRTKQNGSEFDLTIEGSLRQRPFFYDFTDQQQKEFGKLMSEASAELGWPSGQSWQGTHMFRHGGVQDGFKEGQTLLAKLRSGHKSDKSLRLYAATDAERTIKLTDQKADQKTRNNMLNEFLDVVEKQANAITTTRNTNVTFSPNTISFDENRQQQDELKWKKMIIVWTKFRDDIIATQTNNNNSLKEDVQEKTSPSVEDLKTTLNQHYQHLQHQIQEIQKSLGNLTKNIKNNPNNQQKQTTPKGLNVLTNQQSGIRYQRISDFSKILTRQQQFLIKNCNVNPAIFLTPKGYIWDQTNKGWFRRIN